MQWHEPPPKWGLFLPSEWGNTTTLWLLSCPTHPQSLLLSCPYHSQPPLVYLWWFRGMVTSLVLPCCRAKVPCYLVCLLHATPSSWGKQTLPTQAPIMQYHAAGHRLALIPQKWGCDPSWHIAPCCLGASFGSPSWVPWLRASSWGGNTTPEFLISCCKFVPRNVWWTSCCHLI